MTNSSRDYVRIAAGYASDVLSGKIPACAQVRQMILRQAADLDRRSFSYIWRPEKGADVCEFLEYLRHVKGKWAGQPFVLEPWQVFFVLTLFGWVHKSTGFRRFREAFLLVPRKNGKTFLAAGLALYMLLADRERGGEIYCGANSQKQAMYVFATAQQMLRQDEELRNAFGVEVFASNISVAATGSKFEPEIRNVRDGASPHFAVTDELHEAKDSHMVDAFSTGMGARTQPLLLIISTAGVNTAGPCFERQKALEQVLSGNLENDRLFGCVYTIDPDDDWQDSAVWQKANPNFGTSVSPEFIEQKLAETKTYTARRNINLCKHLNVWNASNQAFLDMRAWMKCERQIVLDDFAGQPCWVGLDLSSKVDIAALVILFRDGDGWAVFGRWYLPQETIDRPENSHYQGWHYKGLLTATDGAVIDFGRIEDDLRELAGAFEVQSVGYDPFQATQLSTRLTAEGFPMVETRPTAANFSEPMKELESLVLQNRLHHNGDPVLQWMAGNVIAVVDTKENIYPRKEVAANKIDGIVALIMALGRALADPTPDRSVYESRGLVVL